MADNDLKRFDIVSGQVQRVYEFDDGRWELENIDRDESYSVSGADVLHLERDDGRVETTTYRDVDGSGIFREVSVSFSQPDPIGLPVASQVSDASLVRLYMSTFDRSPDALGFRNWENQIDRGMSLNEVAFHFVNSDEFNQTYGALNNAGFVDRLYLNALDRTADAGGRDGWTGLLDSQAMSRQEVVLAFSESAEFIALSQAGVDRFLQPNLNAGTSQSGASLDNDASLVRLYMTTFDRNPDLQGFRNWDQLMDRGTSLQEVALSFVSSDEFNQTYGALNNVEFVEQLYLNALGRGADAGGRDAWSGLLDSQAMTREEVVIGFSESAEFIALSSQAVEGFIQLAGQPVATEAFV